MICDVSRPVSLVIWTYEPVSQVPRKGQIRGFSKSNVWMALFKGQTFFFLCMIHRILCMLFSCNIHRKIYVCIIHRIFDVWCNCLGKLRFKPKSLNKNLIKIINSNAFGVWKFKFFSPAAGMHQKECQSIFWYLFQAIKISTKSLQTLRVLIKRTERKIY